ncbi:MAG: hypothetical protein PUC98_08340, partial [Clostridiales bacterium]|nr:hypothetical protein [Clostridiales bacterium]
MAKNNKLKPKQKRELEKQYALKIHQANEAKRLKAKQEEEERIRKENEERKRKEAIAAIEETMSEEEMKIRKSSVKAAGLKSAFYLGDDRDELLVTSFGRGPEACREKRIKGNDITDIRKNITVSCPQEEAGKAFAVSGRHITDARRDNPLFFKNDSMYGTDSESKDDAGQNNTAAEQVKPVVGMDQIRLKSALEKRFFVDERNQPRTFSDNIHIQLIYNILDIDKILAVQANNIIFAINNLFREEGDEHDDFIGESFPDYTNLSKNENNKESYVYKLNRFKTLARCGRLGYFGEGLMPDNLLAGVDGCKTRIKNGKKEVDITDDPTLEIYFRELYNVF